MITSLLMSEACSVSKAFEDYSFEEYSEDYQDSDEKETFDDVEEDECLYEDNEGNDAGNDNLTKAYNWVLNNPYMTAGYLAGVLLGGRLAIESSKELYDVLRGTVAMEDSPWNPKKLINEAISNYFPNTDTNDFSKFKLEDKLNFMAYIAEKIGNMMDTNPSFLASAVGLGGSTISYKTVKQGAKWILRSKWKRLGKNKLKEDICKWLSADARNWACFQFLAVLRLCSDKLGLTTYVMKDKTGHSALLLPVNEEIYFSPQFVGESQERSKGVIRYDGAFRWDDESGGIVQNVYGFNKGDVIFGNNKCVEVLKKTWKAQKINENEIQYVIPEDPDYKNKSYETLMNILNCECDGINLKELDPKKSYYLEFLNKL